MFPSEGPSPKKSEVSSNPFSRLTSQKLEVTRLEQFKMGNKVPFKVSQFAENRFELNFAKLNSNF